MTDKKGRVVFMGTPEFAVASLKALCDAGIDIALVVTAPDRPAGRGQQVRRSPVKISAEELRIPILQPEKLRDPEFIDVLQRLDADLFVVVAFRMLPEAVWRIPPKGTLNLHASLLPDLRGAAPLNWAIMHGMERTGVTTFFITREIDTGDVIHQAELPIGKRDTVGDLHDAAKKAGSALLVRTVQEVLAGTATATPQHAIQVEHMHAAPKLNTENCRIDWNRDASEVYDHVRGLSPYPGAWTNWMEEGSPAKRLKVLEVDMDMDVDNAHSIPGTMNTIDGKVWVRCGTGRSHLITVQLEGKKAMAMDDLARGMRGSIKDVHLE